MPLALTIRLSSTVEGLYSHVIPKDDSSQDFQLNFFKIAVSISLGFAESKGELLISP